MRTIEEMRRSGVSITPGLTIREAAIVMEQSGVGSLAIIDGADLVGIVTDRDLVRRGLAKGLLLDSPVHAVMSSPVITIDSEADLDAAFSLFRTHNFRRLAVVSGSRFVGMITVDDLIVDLSADLRDLSRPIAREVLLPDYDDYHEGPESASASSGPVPKVAPRRILRPLLHDLGTFTVCTDWDPYDIPGSAPWVHPGPAPSWERTPRASVTASSGVIEEVTIEAVGCHGSIVRRSAVLTSGVASEISEPAARRSSIRRTATCSSASQQSVTSSLPVRSASSAAADLHLSSVQEASRTIDCPEARSGSAAASRDSYTWPVCSAP